MTIRYAKAFDARPDSVTCSTLFFGTVTVNRTDFETGDSRPLCEIVRDKWFASPDFDGIRDTEEFQSILRALSIPS